MTRQPSTASHPPEAAPAPPWPESADHHLGAVISLDVPRDTVHVHIGGSLTSGTRSQLLGIAGRIRALRAGSHIHVQLVRAAFVRSGALAGLRSDLEAMAGNSGGKPGHGRGGCRLRHARGNAPWRPGTQSWAVTPVLSAGMT